MINMPSVLLLNCVGSYFYSIMEHLSNGQSTNPTLFYLMQGELKYQTLSMEKVYDTFRLNPWGYQPIQIKNLDNDDLEINNTFFDFLYKNYNVKTEQYDVETNNLNDLFFSVDNDNSFLICTVDEYYISQSEFYQKNHNKHFLLIKSMDHINNIFQIVDSEKNRVYDLQRNQLVDAVNNDIFKRKIIYRVDGENFYQTKLNYQMDNVLIGEEATYFEGWLEDIEHKRKDETNPFEYYYKGYSYNIVSKILPFYTMCSKLYENNLELRNKYRMIVLEWKNLLKYMKLKVYRKNVDAENLMHKIIKIENEIRKLKK